MRQFCLLAILLLTVVTQTHAGDAHNTLIDRWYRALGTINRAEIADLLSNKATITLGDMDIQQSKTEFLASLDEWEDAIRGSTIRHTIESDQRGRLSMLVCYKFPHNERLTREIFIFEGSKILKSSQETVADSCATFPN